MDISYAFVYVRSNRSCAVHIINILNQKLCPLKRLSHVQNLFFIWCVCNYIQKVNLNDLPPRKIDYQMCLCVCALEQKWRSVYLISCQFSEYQELGSDEKVQSSTKQFLRCFSVCNNLFCLRTCERANGIFHDAEP